MSDDLVVATHDVLMVGGGRRRPARRHRDRGGRAGPRRGRGVQGLPDAQPHRLRRGRRGGGDRRGRQHRRARLRHDLGQRLARRPGRDRGVRPRGPARAAAARALGLPLEPSARWPRRGARLRRHEEDAHLVRRGQDRFPHAARAVPDLAEVPRRHPLRRVVRDPAAGRRRSGPRAGGRGAAHRTHPGHHRHARWCSPPAAAARSSRSPPTPTSTPATAWRSPTGPARRSRTWSSSSTTRPACPSPAS